jgi:hypothetical protein
MLHQVNTLNVMSQLLFTESFRIPEKQGYNFTTLGTTPLSYNHVDDPTCIIRQLLNEINFTWKSINKTNRIIDFIDSTS